MESYWDHPSCIVTDIGQILHMHSKFVVIRTFHRNSNEVIDTGLEGWGVMLLFCTNFMGAGIKYLCKASVGRCHSSMEQSSCNQAVQILLRKWFLYKGEL